MKHKIAKWLRNKRFEMTLKSINAANGKTLLEIGCDKDQLFIKQLDGMKAIGLDLQLGTKVEKTLDFPDKSFDYVVMIATIEHIEYPNHIIMECHRVLKPNGKLIITTPKDSFILNIWENLFWKENLKLYPNIAMYNKDNLSHAAESFGFDLREYKTFEFGLNQLFVFERHEQRYYQIT